MSVLNSYHNDMQKSMYNKTNSVCIVDTGQGCHNTNKGIFVDKTCFFGPGHIYIIIIYNIYTHTHTQRIFWRPLMFLCWSVTWLQVSTPSCSLKYHIIRDFHLEFSILLDANSIWILRIASLVYTEEFCLFQIVLFVCHAYPAIIPKPL